MSTLREPTWANQLAAAREVYAKEGYSGLSRHARICFDSRCKCLRGKLAEDERSFCCAAVEVLREQSCEGRRR